MRPVPDRARPAGGDATRTGAAVADARAESPRGQAADVTLAAATDASVLVMAPSSAARYTLARTIHAQSERRSGPFVLLDGAAATCASAASAFARARGGLLFVDGVERMRGAAQRRLLRLLAAPAAGNGSGARGGCEARVVVGAEPAFWADVAARRVLPRLAVRVSSVLIESRAS
jgi:DNA-binding NtrC family response regulator